MLSKSLLEEGNTSTLIIAFIVLVFVYIVFSPRKERLHERHQNLTDPSQRQDIPQRQPDRNIENNRFRREINSNQDDEGIHSFLSKCSQTPPHHSGSLDKSTWSHDGILSFKSTKAFTFEMNNSSEEEKLNNKRDRARILAKIFKVNPPSKGSVIVVSVSSSVRSDRKVHRVLFLLGTFYNVFVLVQIEDARISNEYTTDKLLSEELVSTFYSYDLHDHVIPRHRIIPTKSIESRIAFVRQLPHCKYIIGSKGDDELMKQLTKFGNQVILTKIESLLG